MRVFYKVISGVVTFGDTPPPRDLYAGPTARDKVDPKEHTSGTGPGAVKAPLGGQTGKGDRSLGNVNRDDKTAIELFLAGIRGWEAGLRRTLNAR
ncbi:hypothetical protein Pan216_35730 [Planctomycetes bacterium Pan216]|uniref:Uncharacterized protein n=1 Tax=Kolteria novifilia TaxID=2527975 RepID=A0A518B6V3_9BACT|nr:hypothetical protein Pan216_35730 [Planctomycetes bacterium Pan216]